MFAASPTIESLLIAISEHEGWFPVGSVGHSRGSVAYRNHNPGNLRSSPFAVGTSDGFAVFRSDAVGFNALQWDLIQKSKGNTVTGLGPDSTLRDLIYVYAPPSDNNNTAAYLAAVVAKTGIDEDTTLRRIFEL